VEGASGLALASNGMAYVAGKDAGAVAVIDATDALQPKIVREISDDRLRGVTDLCAAGGDVGNSGTVEGAAAAVIFAIVPSASRLVVLQVGRCSYTL
jgi:hypothetical protein